MGSCTPRDTSPRTIGGTSGLAIVGSFDPTTGRVAWSQASPQHEGITWEVWGQLYSSSSLEEEGKVADRILASWQDSEGRRGNRECAHSRKRPTSLKSQIIALRTHEEGSAFGANSSSTTSLASFRS